MSYSWEGYGKKVFGNSTYSFLFKYCINLNCKTSIGLKSGLNSKTNIFAFDTNLNVFFCCCSFNVFMKKECFMFSFVMLTIVGKTFSGCSTIKNYMLSLRMALEEGNLVKWFRMVSLDVETTIFFIIYNYLLLINAFKLYW